jgi:hypothetical protein
VNQIASSDSDSWSLKIKSFYQCDVVGRAETGVVKHLIAIIFLRICGTCSPSNTMSLYPHQRRCQISRQSHSWQIFLRLFVWHRVSLQLPQQLDNGRYIMPGENMPQYQNSFLRDSSKITFRRNLYPCLQSTVFHPELSVKFSCEFPNYLCAFPPTFFI